MTATTSGANTSKMVLPSSISRESPTSAKPRPPAPRYRRSRSNRMRAPCGKDCRTGWEPAECSAAKASEQPLGLPSPSASCRSRDAVGQLRFFNGGEPLHRISGSSQFSTLRVNLDCAPTLAQYSPPVHGRSHSTHPAIAVERCAPVRVAGRVNSLPRNDSTYRLNRFPKPAGQHLWGGISVPRAVIARGTRN